MGHAGTLGELALCESEFGAPVVDHLAEQQGCSEHAVQDLTRALDIAPAADAYSRRGACLLSLGRPHEAIQDLTRAMELDPSTGRYLERGTAYSAVGDHRRAIADLDRAVEKHPTIPDPYRLRAAEREKMRRWTPSYQKSAIAVRSPLP